MSFSPSDDRMARSILAASAFRLRPGHYFIKGALGTVVSRPMPRILEGLDLRL